MKLKSANLKSRSFTEAAWLYYACVCEKINLTQYLRFTKRANQADMTDSSSFCVRLLLEIEGRLLIGCAL